MQIMLLVFAVIACVAGYVLGSFQMMILIYAGGVTLTTLITVPNWPFFNRNPLNWLDPSEAQKHPKPQISLISLWWLLNFVGFGEPRDFICGFAAEDLICLSGFYNDFESTKEISEFFIETGIAQKASVLLAVETSKMI
ncbi:hypothetical protein CRYUN_Cryun21dG0050600 [Craigia yunnanensis]